MRCRIARSRVDAERISLDLHLPDDALARARSRRTGRRLLADTQIIRGRGKRGYTTPCRMVRHNVAHAVLGFRIDKVRGEGA